MRLTKLQRQIKATNEAFAKLRPAQKRVAIARDVLLQLANKKFVARQGTYVSLGRRLTEDERRKDASEVFTTTESCTVCGIGGLFVSAVCKADKLPIAELEEYSPSQGTFEEGQMFEYLEQFFDIQTLRNIEQAFEQRDDFDGEYGSESFAEDVDDDDEILRLIMENIVVNKGEFRFEQSPIHVWVTPNFKG